MLTSKATEGFMKSVYEEWKRRAPLPAGVSGGFLGGPVCQGRAGSGPFQRPVDSGVTVLTSVPSPGFGGSCYVCTVLRLGMEPSCHLCFWREMDCWGKAPPASIFIPSVLSRTSVLSCVYTMLHGVQSAFAQLTTQPCWTVSVRRETSSHF